MAITENLSVNYIPGHSLKAHDTAIMLQLIRSGAGQCLSELHSIPVTLENPGASLSV